MLSSKSVLWGVVFVAFAMLLSVLVVGANSSSNLTNSSQDNLALNDSVNAPSENVSANSTIANESLNSSLDDSVNATNSSVNSSADAPSINSSNSSRRNVTFVDEVRQHGGSVYEPVVWEKVVRASNTTRNFSVIVPEHAVVESVGPKTEKPSERGMMQTTSTSKSQRSKAVKMMNQRGSNLSVETEAEADELLVRYKTPAPEVKVESPSLNKRRMVISSDYHYKNLTSFMEVPEAPLDKINLYWVKNGSKVPLDFTGLDSDSDGLVDRVEWIVPHLSTQVFEVEVDVLNVQSYPVLYGNWTVEFSTVGSDDLVITPVNTTLVDDSADGDLQFLKLYCAEEEVPDVSFDTSDGIISSLTLDEYSCENNSRLVVKELTTGEHHLRFEMGDSTAWAHNYATSATRYLSRRNIGLGGYTFNYLTTESISELNISINSSTVSCSQSSFGSGWQLWHCPWNGYDLGSYTVTTQSSPSDPVSTPLDVISPSLDLSLSSGSGDDVIVSGSTSPASYYDPVLIDFNGELLTESQSPIYNDTSFNATTTRNTSLVVEYNSSDDGLVRDVFTIDEDYVNPSTPAYWLEAQDLSVSGCSVSTASCNDDSCVEFCSGTENGAADFNLGDTYSGRFWLRVAVNDKGDSGESYDIDHFDVKVFNGSWSHVDTFSIGTPLTDDNGTEFSWYSFEANDVSELQLNDTGTSGLNNVEVLLDDIVVSTSDGYHPDYGMYTPDAFEVSFNSSSEELVQHGNFQNKVIGVISDYVDPFRFYDVRIADLVSDHSGVFNYTLNAGSGSHTINVTSFVGDASASEAVAIIDGVRFDKEIVDSHGQSDLVVEPGEEMSVNVESLILGATLEGINVSLNGSEYSMTAISGSEYNLSFAAPDVGDHVVTYKLFNSSGVHTTFNDTLHVRRLNATFSYFSPVLTGKEFFIYGDLTDGFDDLFLDGLTVNGHDLATSNSFDLMVSESGGSWAPAVSGDSYNDARFKVLLSGDGSDTPFLDYLDLGSSRLDLNDSDDFILNDTVLRDGRLQLGEPFLVEHFDNLSGIAENGGVLHNSSPIGFKSGFRAADYSLGFDGDDYVTIPDQDSLDIKKGFSFSIEVNASDISGPPQTIFSKGNYQLKEYDDQYVFEVIGDNSDESAEQIKDLSPSVGNSIVYDGKLYVIDDSNDEIHSFDGNSWTNTGSAGSGPEGLAVYDGKLYSTNKDSDDVYVYNGESWSKSGDVGAMPRGMVVYEDRLYVANKDSDDIFVFDGTSWSNKTDVGDGPESLSVYDNKLHVSHMYSDNIHSYDGDDWTVSKELGSRPTGMATYRDRFYTISRKSEEVWEYSDDDWFRTENILGDGLVVYGDKLYTSAGYVYDGQTWSDSGIIGGSVYDGKLYYGENGKVLEYGSGKSLWVNKSDGTQTLTVIVDNAEIKIAVDGDVKASDSYDFNFLGNSDDLFFGKGFGSSQSPVRGGNDEYFNGDLDNVKLFDRALSGSEVSALYNGSEVVNATHHWSFDEGSGSSVSDSIGTADGTLVGGEWLSEDYSVSYNLSKYPRSLSLHVKNPGENLLKLEKDAENMITLSADNTSMMMTVVGQGESSSVSCPIDSQDWTQWAVSFDGFEARLFKDNVVCNSTFYKRFNTSDRGTLQVGGFDGVYSGSAVDELSVYEYVKDSFESEAVSEYEVSGSMVTKDSYNVSSLSYGAYNYGSNFLISADAPESTGPDREYSITLNSSYGLSNVLNDTISLVESDTYGPTVYDYGASDDTPPRYTVVSLSSDLYDHSGLENATLHVDTGSGFSVHDSVDLSGNNDKAYFVFDTTPYSKGTVVDYYIEAYDSNGRQTIAETKSFEVISPYQIEFWSDLKEFYEGVKNFFAGTFSQAREIVFEVTTPSLFSSLDESSSDDIFYNRSGDDRLRLEHREKRVYDDGISKSFIHDIDPDDVVAYWSLDDGEGATTFKDHSGNGNDGICSGDSCP
ncbi:MAG: LamG-like jellyroll fold domain-containing protein, partial [Candidatus Woesearchaeota archaeon]